MKILLKVFPQDSHFNATIPLGRALQARGCEVVYAAYPERREAVESQGFAFHPQAEDLLPRMEPPVPGAKVPGLLQLAAAVWLYQLRRTGRLLGDPLPADAFDQLVSETKPDAILVDSPYSRFAVALLKHRIPFGILESMVRLDARPNVPPPSSGFVPTSRLGSRAWAWLLWRRYWLATSAMSLVGMFPLPARRHVEKVARASGLPAINVDYRRYFHVGLLDVPEFILSPAVFDFPGAPRSNQHYIGPSVDLQRRDTGYDYYYADRLQPLVARRAHGTPLVICSLGSAAWRYPGIREFFRRVIDAAEGQSFSLVLVIGHELDPRLYDPLPPNVTVFQRVPQLEVLKVADLAITHGGMNTIAECILLGVPMLVYPGTRDLDQPGNAARVEFHRIGLQGHLSREPARRIREKILTVLRDPAYRQRIDALCGQIEQSDAWRQGAELVLSALYPSHASHGSS